MRPVHSQSSTSGENTKDHHHSRQTLWVALGRSLSILASAGLLAFSGGHITSQGPGQLREIMRLRRSWEVRVLDRDKGLLQDKADRSSVFKKRISVTSRNTQTSDEVGT